MVDDRMPPLLTIGQRVRIINPSSLHAPSRLIALAILINLAFGILDPALVLGVHRRRHADRKQPALLGIAKGYIAVFTAKFTALVQHPQITLDANLDRAPLLQQALSFCPEPINDSVDLHRTVLYTNHRLAALQHRPVPGALVPEVLAIDQTVRSIDTPVMIVVLGLAFDLFHRIGARQTAALRRHYRVKKGPAHVVAIAVLGKKLAVNGDDGLGIFGLQLNVDHRLSLFHAAWPQQRLYFFPLPQGHGSLRPGSFWCRAALTASFCFAHSITPVAGRFCLSSLAIKRI